MKAKIFIVEDQFAEAHNLKLTIQKAGYEVCGIARSMDEALTGIAREKPQLVLIDIFLKGNGTGIDLARVLKTQHIAFVYVSANFDTKVLETAKETQPYGFVIKPFRESDVIVTIEIALFRHQQSLESNVYRIKEIQQLLQDGRQQDFTTEDPILRFAMIVQPHFPFDLMITSTVMPGLGINMDMSYQRVGFHEYLQLDREKWIQITRKSEADFRNIIKTIPVDREPAFYTEGRFEEIASHSAMIGMMESVFRIESFFSVPVIIPYQMPIQITFFSRRSDCYTSQHTEMSLYLKSAFQVYFQKHYPAPSGERSEIAKLGTETENSRGSIEPVFPGMIGNSPGLLNVFDSITQVAPFTTSVLLLGESGTGKERVAESIQMLSARKDKPFVKVNCAALAPSLIESELFGHEKGAFTGAHVTHKGHFEEADNGTIFLDEIGEIPPEVQVKLLRILQEKEIRRVGGRSPIKINVRVIAATNCNLEELVAEGRFRLDLYYRLNVFPIQIPPLRERKEDIPALARHFINKYAAYTGKNVTDISSDILDKLMEYDWPGNVRELENLIERSVLRTKGSVIDELHLQLPQKTNSRIPETSAPFKSIEDNEREYILSVLQKSNGKIWGKDGAAALLNMPPTTLNSKIKKMGIRRDSIVSRRAD